MRRPFASASYAFRNAARWSASDVTWRTTFSGATTSENSAPNEKSPTVLR